MNKKYDHIEVEKNKHKEWIDSCFFSKHDDKTKKPFTIILPPPNVTGKLHIGHALDSFIQDTIIRYKKIYDYDVLFLPAMDHAGIATQAKVENRLWDEFGKKRSDFTREEFLQKVWNWKDEFSNTIKEQWAKLGLALDYTGERFTLDEEANNAVNSVFIKLYNDGLIYNGFRPINWDVTLQTAVSNIESIPKETKSKMYYFKYFLENSNDYLVVATTRPETTPSDVALAINPSDEKNKKYIGKKAISIFSKQPIPIIADENIEPDFATGIMKVSAHAEMDIQIIKENNLEINESIDKFGKMNHFANEFEGMDRFEAREAIVNKFEKENLIEKVEAIVNNVKYSEKTGSVIETIVSKQWFVKMDKLAKLLLDDLNSKDKVKFFPPKFEKTLTRWMENVYDWTISRQLWWGHRIPAWYKGEEVKVQLESPGNDWKQDDDVLDTWFSSALAPFAFLGWPNNEEKLNRYYPTNLLVTGYDIIFFWVARMYFQGLYFQGKKPFNDVFIHGLVRDSQGRKMSKSLGNGIDPIKLIDEYGSDALRWYLLTNTSAGHDISFSKEKLSSAWNLNNKIWNISRYIIMLNDNLTTEINDHDKWIANRLANLQKEIDIHINNYEFTLIGKLIYKFVINDLSSWYIEMSKANPNKEFAINLLSNFMILLHPFLPFLSEEIFTRINNKSVLEKPIQEFDTYSKTEYIDDVIQVVSKIREYRSNFGIANKIEINFSSSKELNDKAQKLILKMTNSKIINELGNALIQLDGFSIRIHQDQKQIDQEKDRLLKLKKTLDGEIKRSTNILNNSSFVAKAPKEKIELEKKKYNEYKEKLENVLEELKKYD
ncbi:MAG: valine--tRNA ligase [Mycoplasma sp.]|nr:valine--tRNA ligase [Mycoplasma sp.]